MIKQAFDAGWEYTEGGTFFGMLLTPTQPVTLPHDASIGKARRADHPSGSGGGYAWNGVVSYRKRFHAPSEWQGQLRITRYFGQFLPKDWPHKKKLTIPLCKLIHMAW